MLAPRKTIMADIPEDIKALDMAQLRSKLREMGVNIGPIAPSAKTIFQRRLVKAIAAKSGVANTCTDIVDSSNTATDSSKEVTSKLDSSADTFFALSLPENIDPQLALEGIRCVPLPEWTGIDLITGMDYRNGHLYVYLSIFHFVF